MPLPLSYNARSIRARWREALLAVICIALVVAVLAVLRSMSEGFASTLRATGRRDNAIVVQRGSTSELGSSIPIEHRNAIMVDGRIARGSDGQPLASWESVAVVSLPKASDGAPTYVSLRGVTARAFEVRGGIEIVEGRRFTAGLDEMIVGRALQGRIQGLRLRGTVRCQRRDFRIVGVFASRGGAFESEIWGDFDSLGALLQRGPGSSSLVLRMKNPAEIPAFDRWLRANPQMQLQAIEERRYYEEQAGPLSSTLRQLAGFVASLMGIGAAFGAMNTMYAIAAARTREVGTLRALGFSRTSVLLSFVIESAALALIGGAIGCFVALPMNGFSTETGQTQSFGEIAFAFRMTPGIILAGMAFAVAMGVLGGLLPALRAARQPIVTALREA